MRNVLFWAALPFVLPQALHVRRIAPRFAAAGGPNEGETGFGQPVELLAFGDSIIAGVGARELSRALVGQTSLALTEMHGVRVRWRAFGYVGIDSSGFLGSPMRQLPDADPDYVMISLGVNDITSLTSLDRWRRNLSRLFGIFAERYPRATVAIAGIPPLGSFPLLPQPLRGLVGLRGKSFDAATRGVVARFPNVIHVPVEFETQAGQFAADGFHPSESGYRAFGRTVAAALSGNEPSASTTGWSAGNRS